MTFLAPESHVPANRFAGQAEDKVKIVCAVCFWFAVLSSAFSEVRLMQAQFLCVPSRLLRVRLRGGASSSSAMAAMSTNSDAQSCTPVHESSRIVEGATLAPSLQIIRRSLLQVVKQNETMGGNEFTNLSGLLCTRALQM